MDRVVRATVIAVAALLVATAAEAAGDVARGQSDFARCSACHKVDPNAGPGIGPNLFGIVGRKAGTLPNFAYSTAVKDSAIVWTPEQLQAYVMTPQKVIPGNRMPFGGMANRDQAVDVVAYLGTLH